MIDNYTSSVSANSAGIVKSAIIPFREVNVDRPNDNFDNLVHVARIFPNKITVSNPLPKSVESVQSTEVKSQEIANDDVDPGADVSGMAMLKKKLRRNSSIYMSKEELHNDIQPILDYNRRIVSTDACNV